jgi:hypothetical protein
MNLHPAEFDPTPVAPAPVMFDYMGEPPSSGAELSMTAAPEAPIAFTTAAEVTTPAPATSLDYAEYAAAPGSAASMLEMMAPPPDWAYSTPSSRMGAPR